MKLTKQGRKLIISQIKEGGYTDDGGIYKMESGGFPEYWMIWYKTGKSFEIILGITGINGKAIDLPVGWWDEWLIKRALKKYCK